MAKPETSLCSSSGDKEGEIKVRVDVKIVPVEIAEDVEGYIMLRLADVRSTYGVRTELLGGTPTEGW